MTNDNPLENLEFFDSFSVDDPFEDAAEDPNANVKPDILNGEDYDPLAEETEPEGSQDPLEDDELPLPKKKTPAPVEEEEEEVNLEDDEEEEGDNDVLEAGTPSKKSALCFFFFPWSDS